MNASAVDEELMRRAIANGDRVRLVTSPNPWVGAVVAATDGELFDGATNPPGGPHAEIMALHAAGDRARRSTLYVTLEPCNHTGRTGPCTEAIIDAGVDRVVIGVPDPDHQVLGQGVRRLTEAGITVEVGVCAGEIADQLRPYLHHRTTGRPYVVLKMAATMDGRTAASDGTSKWITGPEARREVHRIRAHSDAVLVGAGTVRDDDPHLTVRDWAPPAGVVPRTDDPMRIVLGEAPQGAHVHPCHEVTGELPAIVREIGRRQVLQLLVEGGARTAAEFHRLGLVDRYELFVAPAFMGGDDGRSLFAGPGAESIIDLWQGRFESVTMHGRDLQVTLLPGPVPGAAPQHRHDHDHGDDHRHDGAPAR
jgi:diaminohydroxyphosphoribosylaminopyrimidine deaminase/5-amino-6-(5-phosphoribosylamino)uracil reductase